MTTHTISSPGGAYAISGISLLTITGAGAIVATGASQSALTNAADTGVTVINSGAIDAYAGGFGPSGYNAGIGGTGGVGARTSVAWSLFNYGSILGGAGGVGGNSSLQGGFGGPGGYGGDGVYMAAGGYFKNTLTATGGAGGLGGYGPKGIGVGGLGGDGAFVLGATNVVNNGALTGGQGGAGPTGHPSGGPGGDGGAGIYLGGTSSLLNTGTVTGGAGGTSGSGEAGAHPGGTGGDGVDLASNSVNNSGQIVGGIGGTGSYGMAGGSNGGLGGAGVRITDGGSAFNHGTITGGAGGVAGGESAYANVAGGGSGGVGAVLAAGGAFHNYGKLAGGAGAAGATGPSGTITGGTGGQGGNGGAGASLTSGGYLQNTGIIDGGAYGPGGAPGFGGAKAGPIGTGGDGVDVTAGGVVINGPTATAHITGRYGVYAVGGAATVTNFGIIEGTTYSVVFESATDRLIAESGSKLIKYAFGGGGALELAGGSTTISALGGNAYATGSVSANFGGFGTYQIDAGAAAVLTGTAALAAGKTLTNAGTMSVTGTLNDAGALANTGHLTIANGGSIQAQGLITNGGAITLASKTVNTDLRVLAAGLTLGGGGTVSMSGTKARILGATAASTLTNVDNAISGTGFIGANSLTLINQAKGVIDAVGAFGLTVGTKGETLTNQGLMEATGGGILIIANTTVANLGGKIMATNGSPVDLENSVIRGGSISASGTGVVKLNVAGGELDGTASAVSLSGVAFIVNGSNETLEGSIANAGKINLIASTSTSDLIIGAAGATLSGGGQVNMTNSLSNRIYGLASGDALTNVDNRIDGAGLLGNGVMTLDNAAKGQIVGNQNLALTIDTGTNTITNAGLIENVGKGGTVVESAVSNTGTFLAASAGTLTLIGAVTGAGVGQISGGTLFVQQAYAESVTFSGSTGVLELGDSQAFTGQVTGLSKTGTNWLDLVDIGFFAAKTKATYSGTTASGTLTVTDGIHTANIALKGNYLSATWTLSGDGHGGTKVVDPTGGTSGPAASFVSVAAGFGAMPAALPDRSGVGWREGRTPLALLTPHMA